MYSGTSLLKNNNLLKVKIIQIAEQIFYVIGNVEIFMYSSVVTLTATRDGVIVLCTRSTRTFLVLVLEYICPKQSNHTRVHCHSNRTLDYFSQLHVFIYEQLQANILVR